MDENIGMKCWKLVYLHSILEYNSWYYWNIMPKYDNTGSRPEEMEQYGKIHEKLRRELDLNLENVIGRVITLEIAERKLMYRRDICKNPEG